MIQKLDNILGVGFGWMFIRLQRRDFIMKIA